MAVVTLQADPLGSMEFFTFSQEYLSSKIRWKPYLDQAANT